MGENVAEDFLAFAGAIGRIDDRLSPLAAGIVSAVFQDIASDSRTFARIFGVAHALVLREIHLLAEGASPIEITGRDIRTQRTYLQLTPEGETLIAHALDLLGRTGQ